MARDKNGRFLKGNDAAKSKRGYRDRGRQLAKLFTEDDIKIVYETLMTKVAKGDPSALSLISRYVAPAPKSTYQCTPFQYDLDDPMSGAQSIMIAIAAGELPADVGRTLIEALSSIQRIREVVELEERLSRIEADIEGKV